MKIKNVLLTGLSLALVAAVAIGGTLAYLTVDAGNEINVFSVGNINVSLDEEVGIYGEGGEVKETEDGAEYIEVMPGDYLKKEVTVTNNGKTDAYVAVTVTLNNATAINAAIDEVYGDSDKGGTAQKMYDFIFDGWGINQAPRPGKNGNDARGVIDGTYGMPEHVLNVDFTKTIPDDYWLYSAGNWFYGSAEKPGTYDAGYYTQGEGYYAKNMDPDEICYTYYMYLPAGESSTLFKGLNVPAEFTNEQMKMFDGLKIDVVAKAIQADNMAVAEQYKNDPNGKAKTAFAILAGDIETPEIFVSYVSSADELTEALAAGSDIVLTDSIELEVETVAPYGNKYGIKLDGQTIDGNGKTIDFKCYGDDYGIMTSGGTIKNITLKDVARGIVVMSPTEDIILDNVTLKADLLYPFNTAEHATVSGVDLIATNSVFGGWTSFAGIESASFTDCEFVVGTYYDSWPYDSVVKPFVNTVFEACNFANGYYLDLSSLGEGCKVTFRGCTVNGAAITADICGTQCDGTEAFCVELPSGRTLADCVIFE